MLVQEAAGALKQLLWANAGESVYALLDGASVPNLLERLYAEPRPAFECLMHGELAPDMAEVAPYLVLLERDGALTDWVIEQGWGNHWGMFALARADLRTAWFHLRTLNIAYSPEGKPMWFRYYDPRVLRIFLPTCSAEQLEQMFGPIAAFVTEAETSTSALAFARAAGTLQQSSRRLTGHARAAQTIPAGSR